MLKKKRVGISLENNTKYPNGVYVGAYFKKGSQLYNELERNKKGLEKIIPGLKWKTEEEDPGGYHVTIMYSTNPPSTDDISTKDFPKSMEVYFSDLDIFSYGEDNHALVIKLNKDDEESYVELHNKLKEEYELTPSFPDYEPHITLGVFGGEFLEPMKKFVEENTIENEYDERSYSEVTYKIEEVEK